ncbi:PEP-CTERM sorting domain-containing protein [Lacipirellula parvula]|uniref:PEP-CTERM protein-sorting domain-containing protein n=1 Tax=Lacipirellula parvula TaxID=2650471 RepID=A0A5K7XAU9_9BACT|nr:PEP-CTERM sorting domain-containing protein [Lacipirellula parvula]BBO31466.1 hypothetical protein PLANPX_1078 [Lacipirellula parvula]
MLRYLQLAIGLAFCCWSASGRAEFLSLTHNAEKTIWTVYLNGGALNGNFNAISFEAVPTGGAIFEAVSAGLGGIPRPPGMKFTYRNRALDIDPDDPDLPGIGKGWTVLSPVNIATKVAFSGGPLGKTISTAAEPDGKLFLANFYTPTSPGGTFSARVILVNGITTVADETLVPPLVPEPTACGLLLLGMVGVAAVRRGRS